MGTIGGVHLLRYSAFTEDPAGGNPAGVVLGAAGLSNPAMQAIAAEVGYSETAFIVGRGASGEHRVRYFTPTAEVPFCGHATVAAAVALGAEMPGAPQLSFATAAGTVPVTVSAAGDGPVRATLFSIAPTVTPADPADTGAILSALGWTPADLDPELPPRIADAGARHLLLFARRRELLAQVTPGAPGLRPASDRLELVTIALLWREDAATYHARNLGPSVGVDEDSATGGAAAALGGYLAEIGAITPPAAFVVRQGEDMGRPSRLEVHVEGRGAPVAVTGAAVALADPA